MLNDHLKVRKIEAVEEHSVADKLMEPLAKTKLKFGPGRIATIF